MSDDPAHDQELAEKGPAVFGQGEASGENRAVRAAELALADLRRQLSRDDKPETSAAAS